jgi:hypothetical protein
MTKDFVSSFQPKRTFDGGVSSFKKPELPGLRPEGHSNYGRGGEEMLIDFRQRLELEAKERAERRRVNMAEQTLQTNAPSARIRAWERLHELRMPLTPEHPVLNLIAAATQLSMAEVNEEQRLRSGRTTP